MKRRILSFLVMVAIFIGTLGGTAFAAGEIGGQLSLQDVDSKISMPDIELFATHQIFKDVNDTDWYYDFVDYAHYYGLFKGTSDNIFSPGGTMTRAMFATVIFRIFDSIGWVDEIGDPYFTDVNSTDYYYNAVTWCHGVGIIDGVGDAKFAPNNPVTRQEAAKIMGMLFDAEGENIPHVDYTDSSSIASWASEFVDIMAVTELMEGYPDGTFRPLNNMNRAECAKVLSKFHAIVTYEE